MVCDECGDNIFVGDEYWYDPKADTNYHLGCKVLDEQNQLIKRYRRGVL